MKERSGQSPVGRGLEILKDTFDLLSSSRVTKKSSLSKCDCSDGDSDPFDAEENGELKDVRSLTENSSLVEIGKATEPPKPFAAFGSYRQRHGEAAPGLLSNRVRMARRNRGISAEAPAKLGSGPRKESLELWGWSGEEKAASELDEVWMGVVSKPIDIKDGHGLKDNKVHKKLQKQRSFSSDIDREEAWERKRDLHMLDELCDMMPRTIGRCVSDCGDRSWTRPEVAKSRSRTRSLTDEDLEELRGCIDLGFGFSYDESCDLRGTLPALDLYYAINRQYKDIKSRSSPVSTLDGAVLERTSSGGSPCSPMSETWKIASPGDHPNQVKTRLRHWAQAVACSIKQGV